MKFDSAFFDALLDRMDTDPEFARKFSTKVAASLPGISSSPPPVNSSASGVVAPQPLPVCPDIKDITLLQATFFNNGEKGQRNRGASQFKMTLEVWTERGKKKLSA